MPFHGSSEFAHRSHFAPLDRNDRARFRFLVGVARGNRRISSGQRDVALELLALHGPDGRLDPCHATLARRAQVSEDTVLRALGRLRRCGLVSWTRRLVRTRAGARQTSSAYRLHLPGLHQLAALPRRRPDPQNAVGTWNVRISGPVAHPPAVLAAALHVPADQPSLAELARRRAEERNRAWLASRMGSALLRKGS